MRERRKEIRYPDINRVHIELASDNRSETHEEIDFALTENLSQGGSKILCSIPLDAASILKIRYFLRKSGSIVEMLGIVRWMNSHQDELYEIGVEHFHHQDESLRLHIERISNPAAA